MKYYLLLIVFFFSNCTAQTHDRVVVSHYDNTHVKKQVFDSLEKLHSVQIFLKDGDNLVADGYIKVFWPNGKIHALGFFKNGKHDSVSCGYTEQGHITDKFYIVADTIVVGSYYTYYNNGQVNTYRFKVVPDSTVLALQFDSLGHLTEKQGRSMTRVVYDEKAIYSKEDTVYLKYAIAMPDNLRTEVVVSIILNGKQTKWKTMSDIEPLHIADIEVFSNPRYRCVLGPTDYFTVLNMYDTTTNKLLISDTDCYHINVKM
jgi:hypothetical protein